MKNHEPQRRISFYVSDTLYNDLQKLSSERGETITGLLRRSINISTAILEEIKNGSKIKSESPNGNQKEFIFGRY